MENLATAIDLLTNELHSMREDRKHDETKTILTRIDRLEQKIMATAQELIDAATTLSTAADGVSVKLDTLITAADAVIVALQNVQLPPAADAAVAALKNSTAIAAAAGDRVDAEVVKLDAVLPTPAPAGAR